MIGFDSLKGKVVVITGGTRGIGFSTVKAFLEAGSHVAMFGSREETVTHALEELQTINPAFDVRGYYPNLTDMESVKRVVKEIMKDFGTIDILINNAGISDSIPLYNYEENHFQKVMDINVNSIYNMIRQIAPIMKEKGKGVILNTSSMVSILGQKSGVAYPTSKFAVNGLTKSLARELGKDGIRVNAVAPGIIGTDMVKALDQNIIQAMSATIPLQRVGEPEDIANIFLFLASDLASYITGAILSVDGGFVG